MVPDFQSGEASSILADRSNSENTMHRSDAVLRWIACAGFFVAGLLIGLMVREAQAQDVIQAESMCVE